MSNLIFLITHKISFYKQKDYVQGEGVLEFKIFKLWNHLIKLFHKGSKNINSIKIKKKNCFLPTFFYFFYKNLYKINNK